MAIASFVQNEGENIFDREAITPQLFTLTVVPIAPSLTKSKDRQGRGFTQVSPDPAYTFRF